MDGISSVGNSLPARTSPMTSLVGASESITAENQQITLAESSEGGSIMSVSSTSISSTVESFIGTYGPMLSSNELLGAVLLMLALEYLTSSDEEEKQGLLELMLALAEQLRGGGEASGMFMFSSSSMSIESTQITISSPEMALGSYAEAADTSQQALPSDAGSAGLDVVA